MELGSFRTLILFTAAAVSGDIQLGGFPYLTDWYPPVPEYQYPFMTYLAWQSLLEPGKSYGIIPHGVPGTSHHRLYFRDSLGPISPFHDIPMFANYEKTVLNMIVEIPRWTNAKMEISNTEILNPIKHSMKNGELRYTRHVFPHHGYIWNYGAFPQSWESPKVLDETTGVKGDDDPLDVLEIGSRAAKTGDVIQVKILGALGLIDQGDTDWKIFVIDINDSLAAQMNDVCDIEKHFPGLLKASRDWLRSYKIPDGKQPNTFAFDGEVQNKEFAYGVINRTHDHWIQLVTNPETESNHSRVSVTNSDSPFYMARTAALGLAVVSPADLPTQGQLFNDEEWYFLPQNGDYSDIHGNCTSDNAA